MITQEIQKHIYRLYLIEQEFGEISLSNVFSENRNLVKFLGTDMNRLNLVLELKGGMITESIDEDDPDLVSLFEAFDSYYREFDIEVGDKIALLDLQATSIGKFNELCLGGFTGLKEVVGFSEHFIEFADGHNYPPIDVVKQTSMWRQVLLFKSSDLANECLTYMSLLSGQMGKWNFKIEANGKALNESIKVFKRMRNRIC